MVRPNVSGRRSRPVLAAPAAAFLALLLSSCGELLTGPKGDSSPRATLHQVWWEVDRFYPFLHLKGVSWDSLYAVYRHRVEPDMGDKELFQVLSGLLGHLRDGHVSLESPTQRNSYSRDRRETFYPELLLRYVRNPGSTGGGRIVYGTVGTDAGYVRLATFGLFPLGDLDRALSAVRKPGGLVVDVRGNSGGESSYADSIAGQFADAERLYGYWAYRNGPGPGAYFLARPAVVRPRGGMGTDVPVVVLMDMNCASSCEAFVMAMSTLPQVRLVGERTAGLLGVPIPRELPNGWILRLPVGTLLNVKKEDLEEQGIPPHVHVITTEEDRAAGRDPMLECAFHLLAGGGTTACGASQEGT